MEGKRKGKNTPNVKFFVDKNKRVAGYTVTMLKQKIRNPPKIAAVVQGGLAVPTHDQSKDEAQLTVDSKQKPAYVKNKKRSMTRVALTSLKGQVVIARDIEDGMYYEGVVMSSPSPYSAVVKRYFDEKVSEINTRFILPVKGAVSNPPLRIGDYVLVHVKNENSSNEAYVPGVVQMSASQVGSCYFSVLLYNSQTIVTMRRYIVKISKERFDFTVDHIYQILKVDSYMNGNKQVSEHPSKNIIHNSSNMLIPRETPAGENEDNHQLFYPNKKKGDRHATVPKTQSTRKREDNCLEEDIKIWTKKESSTVNRRLEKKQQEYIAIPERLSPNSFSDSEISEASEQINDISKRKTVRTEAVQNCRSHFFEVDSCPNTISEPKTDNITDRLRKHEQKLEELQNQLQQQSDQHKKEKENLKQKIQELDKKYRNKEQLIKDISKVPKDNQEFDDDEKSHYAGYMTLALLEMRKTLPQIQEQEKVLARWSDDGFYHQGTIVLNCLDFSYLVMDSIGDVEQIWREDIFTETDDKWQDLKVEDKVIAPHPDYSFSYVPALVTALCSNGNVQVCFYNKVMAELGITEIYKMPELKYIHDIKEIKRIEHQWEGQTVVARNDKTGLFFMGCVVKVIEEKHLLRIQKYDGTTYLQSPQHVFGPFTRKPKLDYGNKVLALQNRQGLDYIPGEVTAEEDDRLKVKFFDDSINEDVRQDEIYRLTEDYYEKAVHYFNQLLSKNC